MSSCWTYGTLRTRSRSAHSANLLAATAPLWYQITSVTTITAPCCPVRPSTPGEAAARCGFNTSVLSSVFCDFQELLIVLCLVTRGMQAMTPTWGRATSSKAWTRAFWACVSGRRGSSSSHPSWHTERTALVLTNDVQDD